jgi:four helix bundle protein
MARDGVEELEVHRLAMELWELFWQDSEILMKDQRGRELVRQMVRSIGSIAVNIEEGYGRGFGKEYPQYLRTSRGSARESKGWYQRARHLLPNDIVTKRLELLDKLIAKLSRMIQTLEARHR